MPRIYIQLSTDEHEQLNIEARKERRTLQNHMLYLIERGRELVSHEQSGAALHQPTTSETVSKRTRRTKAEVEAERQTQASQQDEYEVDRADWTKAVCVDMYVTRLNRGEFPRPAGLTDAQLHTAWQRATDPVGQWEAYMQAHHQERIGKRFAKIKAEVQAEATRQLIQEVPTIPEKLLKPYTPEELGTASNNDSNSEAAREWNERVAKWVPLYMAYTLTLYAYEAGGETLALRKEHQIATDALSEWEDWAWDNQPGFKAMQKEVYALAAARMLAELPADAPEQQRRYIQASGKPETRALSVASVAL